MIHNCNIFKKIPAFTYTLLFILISCSSWAKKTVDLSKFPSSIRTEILKDFPEIKHGPVGLDVVDNIIRQILLKGDYDRIQVFEDDNNYNVSFFRAQRINEVRLTGINFFTKSEVENHFSIRTNDLFNQQTLIDEAERLRQYYKEKGYYNTKVEIDTPPSAEKEDHIDIDVKITENIRSLIYKVIIQSANTDLNKALNKIVKSSLNEPLTDKSLAEINKKIRSYLNEERFVRAELSGPTTSFNSDESQATLTYKIEKPENYMFEIDGIRLLHQRDVKNSLDLDNFYSSTSNVGMELSQKIRNYYLSEGYAQTEVTFEEKEIRPPFTKLISFKINEGPRIKINNITINGNFSRKPQYYENIIKEHSSEVISEGFYNKDDLDTGLRNLTLQLQNEGFLQAKVTSTRTQYNKEKTRITMFVNLEEGPLTLINSIEFTGNESFTKEELLKVTGIQPGPLKLNSIETAVENIKIFYHERGYIEMKLLNEKEDLVKYDDTSTQALLNFKIFEGPQVRAASIIIEGNNFTKGNVILKELDFKTGELVTPQKIENSIIHLQKSSFFNSVEVRTLEEKTNVSQRTVLVKVSEREPGLFTIGAGATNERQLTLRGYSNIAYRNLFGTGRGLSLRIEGNYNVTEFKHFESKFVMGYIEPYLFNSRTRGRANITRSSQISNYSIKQITDINSYTYSFENDLSNHVLGTWDVWSLAQVKDSGLDSSYPFSPEQQDIATTGPNLDIDYRDNPFNPTKGHFTRINAEYSDPNIGSTETIKYWKALGSFSHYKKVGTFDKQPVIWANQVRGAYLRNLANLSESKNGVPWDKKGFSLGGTSTVRGYEPGSEYFPNNRDLGIESGNKKYYLTEDASMFLLKSELRFSFAGSLGGAIFYDGGQVLITGLDIKDSYRASTGFGIRYNTPVGPLSFDLAWKLNMQDGESPYRLHLSIGTY